MTIDEKLDELIRLQKETVEAMRYNNTGLMTLCAAIDVIAKVVLKNE